MAANEIDRNRFEKLTNAEVERGRDKEKAKEVAAQEVKELRKREGRSRAEEPETGQ